MENVFFGIAVASFILAAACAIACVVVFAKLEVMDAIRFLRHRTVASGVGLVGVLAHKPKQRKAKAEDLDRDTSPNVSRKKWKHEKASGERDNPDSKTDGMRQQDSDSATTVLTSSMEPGSSTDYLGNDESMPNSCLLVASDREGSTGLLGIEDPEAPTDLPIGEGPESPTDLLVDGSSENPTDLLAEEDSENPTGLLVAEEDLADPAEPLSEEDSEHPASLLVGESSELPTGSLEAKVGEEAEEESLQGEDSEGPTELLAADEPSGRQTTCLAGVKEESEIAPARPEEETVFRFQAKQSQLVVHTEEVIE